MTRRWSTAMALLLVVAACGDGHVDGPGRISTQSTQPAETTRSTRPSPARDTTAEGLSDRPVILSVSAGDTEYVLSDAGSGCHDFEVAVAGFDPTSHYRCDLPDYWHSVSETCFVAPEPGQSAPRTVADGFTGIECDAEIPPVLYGRVPADVGWLCLPTLSDEQIGPVRFVAPREQGWVLEVLQPDEAFTTPFPFTHDGRRWGEPPLDGPASIVYTQCEAIAPWGDPPPGERTLHVVYIVDPALGCAEPQPDPTCDATGLRVDAGTGATGFVLSAAGEGPLDLPIVAFADTGMLRLWYFDEDAGTEDLLGDYPVPAPIRAELRSAWSCTDFPVVAVTIGAGVREGAPGSVSVNWWSSREASERLEFYPGLVTDRIPGEPCPDTGFIPEGGEPTGPVGVAVDGEYLVSLPEAAADLGTDWVLYWSDVDGSGFGIDFGLFAERPGERFGAYLFPGREITVWIDGPEGGDPPSHALTVPAPELAPGAAPPYRLVIDVHRIDRGGPVPRLPEGSVTLRWVEG